MYELRTGARCGVVLLVYVLLVVVLLGGCSSAPDRVVASASEPPSASPSASAPTTPTDPPSTAASPTQTTTPLPSTAPPSPAPSTRAAASCPPPAGLLGDDLERVPTDRKVVALTFDAGANPDAVRSALDTLAAKKVTATFFLTGDFVEDFPDQSREIAASYIVGNHSMTHPELTKLSEAQVSAELTKAEESIRRVTGAAPRPYFRFPFGDVDARTIKIANSLCYVPFRWTADTLGWKGTSRGMSAAKVHERVLGKLQPGEIVLMHLGSNPKDGSTLDADALPGMIDAIRAQGYDFVALDVALQQ